MQIWEEPYVDEEGVLDDKIGGGEGVESKLGIWSMILEPWIWPNGEVWTLESTIIEPKPLHVLVLYYDGVLFSDPQLCVRSG